MTRASENQRLGISKLRLWLGFVVGFLVVWIGLALLIETYPLAADGSHSIRCKLWKYYIVEIRRAFNQSGDIGQSSGSVPAAATTFIQHSLIAAAGGAAALAAAWMVHGARRVIARRW